MELAKISNQELLKRMDKLVQSERKLTHVILCHINEVESRRLYANLGFDSMFNYLTRHCGYGEDSAYRRLQAARLLKKANYGCEYVDQNTNVRCQSHYQLQIDHCIPFAHGGSDEEGNLRVFCRSHNLLSARQWGLSDY